MEPFISMLLQWDEESDQTRVERVIGISQCGTKIWAIDIKDPNALPAEYMRVDFEAAFSAGEVRILGTDPYSRLRCPDHQLSKKQRRRRNKNYEIIAPLVERDDEQIFDPCTRGPLIDARAKELGVSKAKIYGLLRRYWQRGVMKNALVLLSDQSGWRNRDRNRERNPRKYRKEPKNKPTIQGEIKVGRPSKNSQKLDISEGVNIDEETRKRIRWGINLFYKTKEVKTLQEAFQKTLEKYFNLGYHQGRDGVQVPALPPANELPTYNQFTYCYRQDRNPKKIIISRLGESRFNLSNRPILGDSTQMAFGPGSLYQIDATVGDIYLVSSLDPERIIGRPVIYIVSDTFSHMIVGFSVSLEGPSWLGAMLAIENATADKVAFCKEYGITIEEDEWPCCHLPEGLLGDRGELEGYNADNLVNSLNLRIHNTPPFRADWKGIIEQHIDLVSEKAIRWTPGEVRERERGGRDYRLDARLNLHDIRKLMIYTALEHNHNLYLEGYRMDADMIADHVEPYPIALWNWGVRNRSGHLRKLPDEVIKVNLLPEYEASITPRGIRLNGLYYSCDLAIAQNWFMKEEKRRGKKIKKIKVAADPRNVERIYLRLDGGRHLEVCRLVDADEKTFRGRDLYETLEYFELRKRHKSDSRTRRQRSKAEYNAQKEQIISGAEARAENSQNGQSNRSRVDGIRGNRKTEREIERQTDAWKLGDKTSPGSPAQVVTFTQGKQPKKIEDKYVPPSQPMDKLRKLRERRMQK